MPDHRIQAALSKTNLIEVDSRGRGEVCEDKEETIRPRQWAGVSGFELLRPAHGRTRAGFGIDGPARGSLMGTHGLTQYKGSVHKYAWSSYFWL